MYDMVGTIKAAFGGTVLDRDKDGDLDMQDVKMMLGDFLAWIITFVRNELSKAPMVLINGLIYGILAADTASKSDGLGGRSKWDYAMREAGQHIADNGVNILLDDGVAYTASTIARAFDMESESIAIIGNKLVSDLRRDGRID